MGKLAILLPGSTAFRVSILTEIEPWVTNLGSKLNSIKIANRKSQHKIDLN